MESAGVRVRRPTAVPAGEHAAPTFRLDRAITGTTIGVRTDRAWRSWQLIAARWADALEDAGATTIAVETGAQVGRPATSDRKHIDDLAATVDAAIVGLGTCGSCTTFTIKDAVTIAEHEKPVVAVVCEEFAVHARNVATHLGHAHLPVLVLPYPLEARPEAELEQIARDHFAEALGLLGATP
jgi:hypothetical protein